MVWLLKTVLALNQVFSIILNIFQWVSSEKTFHIQITIVPGYIDAKKIIKIFHKLHIKFFSQCLIVNYSLVCAFMVQNICKNSFSGGKSRKNGIPVIKITFSLQTP